MAVILNNQSLWTADAIVQPYEFYSCKTEYFWDSGKIQMPVAATPLGGIAGEGAPGQINQRPSCKIVQATAAWGQRIVMYGAQRLGEKPKLPSPDPQDANQVLSTAQAAFDPPRLTENGQTRIFRAGGIYVYFLLKPYWLLDNLGMGATPYDTTPAAMNIFQAPFFVNGLASL